MNAEGSAALLRPLALVGSLFVFWLAMSGIYTPFLLAAGLGAAVAVSALAWRMEVADHEGHPVHLTPGALAYWPWLVKEIVKSGIKVSRIILDPRLPVSPTLVRFRPSQKSAVGLVTHANSITLTPGTLTVEADHREFLVHALTREAASGLPGSEMDRRVSRLEGSA
ncbi:MAG TPA: Na+/H+ antiporter subunit E [Burkholderiales bacterium]|nr:Na+/H+ antiporter subunit E [Burkholderiales bacterium]